MMAPVAYRRLTAGLPTGLRSLALRGCPALDGEGAIGTHVHDDGVPRREARLEHALGQRILDLVLDLTTERPRAVGLVVALGDDRVLCPIGHDELHLLAGELLLDPRQEQ